MHRAGLDLPLRLIRGLGNAARAASAKVTETATPAVERPAAERRSAPRLKFERHVLIRRRGEVPTPGVVVNISETGAAVRIEPLADITEGVWPFYLVNGDDVWLSGLLDDPVECWVVGVDRDVLRLRFALETALRQRLHRLIGSVAAD